MRAIHIQTIAFIRCHHWNGRFLQGFSSNPVSLPYSIESLCDFINVNDFNQHLKNDDSQMQTSHLDFSPEIQIQFQLSTRNLYLAILQASQTQHLQNGIHFSPRLILPPLILHSMNHSSILSKIWHAGLPTRLRALGPIHLQIFKSEHRTQYSVVVTKCFFN